MTKTASDSSSILLTGATGLLGAHLICRLTDSGIRVKALRRPSSSMATIEKVFKAYASEPEQAMGRIEWVLGDVTDYYSLEDALEGIDKIFHTAGYISFAKRERKRLEDINVGGTANLVNAALHRGVRKLIHVSTVESLGRMDLDELITETTPWKNSPLNTHYGVTKHAGEREAWRAAEEGMDVLVVNPGLIIGLGDWNSGTGRIVQRMAQNQSFYTEGSNGWVDVRDVARAMIDLDDAGVHGERFILVSENLDMKTGFEKLALNLGTKAPHRRAGKILLNIAAWTEKFKSFVTGAEPLITTENAVTASLKSRYDNSKLFKFIPFEYTPMDETFREVSMRYRAEQNAQ